MVKRVAEHNERGAGRDLARTVCWGCHRAIKDNRTQTWWESATNRPEDILPQRPEPRKIAPLPHRQRRSRCGRCGGLPLTTLRPLQGSPTDYKLKASCSPPPGHRDPEIHIPAGSDNACCAGARVLVVHTTACANRSWAHLQGRSSRMASQRQCIVRSRRWGTESQQYRAERHRTPRQLLLWYPQAGAHSISPNGRHAKARMGRHGQTPSIIDLQGRRQIAQRSAGKSTEGPRLTFAIPTETQGEL